MFKSILVLADDTPAFETALRVTKDLARQFDAHLNALLILPDPASAVASSYHGMHPSVMEEFIRLSAQSNEERERRARSVLERVASNSEASWRVAIGFKTDIAPAAARVCDLTVISRPTEEDDKAIWKSEVESVLFNSGRPMLLLPHGNPISFLGKPAAVGWNGTATAARAIGPALPILRLAERTDIFTAGRIDPYASTGDLIANLSRHGIKAAPQELESSEVAMGKSLLEQCHLRHDRLLVMGAYGHSRMREMVLGGATQQILEFADLPVLMAH